MAFLERWPLPLTLCTLKAGQGTALSFETRDLPGLDAAHSRILLRLRGDVGLHPSWMYEGGLPFYYRDIDDALTEDTHHSRFALRLSAKGEDWPRRMHYKIQCPPKINSQYPVPAGGGPWRFTCWVRTEGLRLLPGGCAKITFSHYTMEEGRNPRDINGPAKETVTLNFPTGDCDWMQLSCPAPLGPDSAAMLVKVSLEHAWGTLWLEDLRLENGHGFNILPPIDQTNRYHECFNWYGENLSHKEWTDLEVNVNGTVVEASLFQRCFRGSENEIELPLGCLREGENRITLTNVSAYHDPLPWNLVQAELLAERTATVRVAWCPETVPAHGTFGVLLKTYEPNVRVRVETDGGLRAPAILDCPEPGLQVLPVTAGAPAGIQTVTVEAAGCREQAAVQRIVEKEQDGLLVGSGDAIYVPQETARMEDFLIWYLENGLGNLLTFRPVYRWSGTRSCNDAMWRRLTDILNRLGLSYCHMFDGRELPGLNANPTKASLAGPGFLGCQAHERDGALYYWLQRKFHGTDVFFEELSHKILRHPDYPNYHLPLTYDGDQTWLCFSPTAPRDMREAAEQFVSKARTLLGGMKRHTGPSTLFKYFFQAGLEVGGAELMYGPLEVVLAALRGASSAYEREVFTAHLAVQWGTTPHDTEERYRRYQLALFVSYLQGVTHINTEEGLYRMEEFFAVLDRFSEPCRRHQQVERDFFRFVSTHSRRGRLHRGIALLHGAYDGWACFCRRNVWAQEGKEWEFSPAEESWDLINVFYPDSRLDAIYCHPCPAAPQGYDTRTPYGTVDILPVEADESVFSRYPALAFLGWNTADEDQIRRLTEYVRRGGTLILGWPHLFTDVRRADVFRGASHPLDASELTGVKLLAFEDHGGMHLGRVTLGPDAQALRERDGLPLVVRNCLGAGTVYFVNAREYPAEGPVRPVYEALLRMLGEGERQREMQTGFLESAGTVESSIYDVPDGSRVIYAVNTDWYSQAVQGAATLWVKGQGYPVTIGRGVIHTFTIHGDAAAETCDSDTEVLSLTKTPEGLKIKVQGQPGGRVTLYQNGTAETVILTEPGVTEFCVKISGERPPCPLPTALSGAAMP